MTDLLLVLRGGPEPEPELASEAGAAVAEEEDDGSWNQDEGGNSGFFFLGALLSLPVSDPESWSFRFRPSFANCSKAYTFALGMTLTFGSEGGSFSLFDVRGSCPGGTTVCDDDRAGTFRRGMG